MSEEALYSVYALKLSLLMEHGSEFDVISAPVKNREVIEALERNLQENWKIRSKTQFQGEDDTMVYIDMGKVLAYTTNIVETII